MTRPKTSPKARPKTSPKASKRICVFCGANPGNDPRYAEAAQALGTALAEHAHGLVFGGGRVGLMGTIADAALAGGGEVVGFMPRSLVDREIGHSGLTELVITDSMHARKAAMADRADGFVALPGGFGTLDEVLEILTWNQIGVIAKPVAFLDVDGYYESLFRFFDDAVTAGLVNPEHRAMAQRATTVADAIDIASGPAPANVSKWTQLPNA